MKMRVFINKRKFALIGVIGLELVIVDVIINALLIPDFASAGAAIGTLVAEFVVLIVQYAALHEKVTDTLKQIHYGRIVIALILATAASLWIKMLGLGLFLTLVISAVLFFGVYGVYLLICKEEMIVEIWDMVVGKVIRIIRGNK